MQVKRPASKAQASNSGYRAPVTAQTKAVISKNKPVVEKEVASE